MSQQQRAAVVAELRANPLPASKTMAEARASFAERFGGRAPGDDVTVRDRTLGGRPALDITVDGADDRGVILFLHGGAYVVGSADTGVHLAATLARTTGVRAISLDYRLAPEHPFPAAVDDALAAYRELLEEGVRADEIALAGDSAGGGLSIATLLAIRAAALPQPAAAVVFSPWVDLSLSGASMRTREDADPLFTREQLGAFAARYLADTDPRTHLASPLFADLTGLAPLLVQVGTVEVLLDDAVRLAVRAAEHDVDVSLDVVAGAPHVFQSNAGSGTLDEADEAMERAGRFLASRLGDRVEAR